MPARVDSTTNKPGSSQGMRWSAAFALEIIGELALRASTYTCHMRDDLGVSGCIAIGSLMMLVAGMLVGYNYAQLSHIDSNFER